MSALLVLIIVDTATGPCAQHDYLLPLITMSYTVWRHVDKTGPEGNIDALLQHGQGDFSYYR